MFRTDEDALEFLDDYDLDEARAKMLKESGNILESARIHAKKGDMLKAVETLTASTILGVDRVRPTIEYLLTGLRRGLTLEMLPTSAPAVPGLLGFVDRLDRSAMTEQEANEVSFPIHSGDKSDTLPSPACDV